MTKQKQTSAARIQAALNVIVDNFTDPVEYTDRNGVIKTWNRLGFPLEKFLRGALFQMHRGLDYNENVRTAKLKDEYLAARNANQQTEITINQMADAQRKKHELDDQIVAMKEVIEILEATYEAQMGKAFVYRTSAADMGAKPVEDKQVEATTKAGDELFGI